MDTLYKICKLWHQNMYIGEVSIEILVYNQSMLSEKLL
jgi:hypothetical protein